MLNGQAIVEFLYIYIFLYIHIPEGFLGTLTPCNDGKPRQISGSTEVNSMGSQWVTCTEDIFPANPAMGRSTLRWIWDPDVYFETQICLKLLQVLEVVWMQHSAKSNHFVIAQGT